MTFNTGLLGPTPTFDQRLERVAWFLDDWADTVETSGGSDVADGEKLIVEARELAAFVRGGLPKA